MDRIRLEDGKIILAKEIGNMDNAQEIDIDQTKLNLRIELSNIIVQVKGLKQRADEIQEILKYLDNN